MKRVAEVAMGNEASRTSRRLGRSIITGGGAASSFVPGFLSGSVRPGQGRFGFPRLPERRKDLADRAAKAGHDVLA